MVSLAAYRKMAKELPGAAEQIHSGMPAFAVGKRRFSIFDPKKGMLALKLPLTDPVRSESVARGLLEAAPGRYGAEGWVSVDLERIEMAEFVALLEATHRHVAPKAR